MLLTQDQTLLLQEIIEQHPQILKEGVTPYTDAIKETFPDFSDISLIEINTMISQYKLKNPSKVLSEKDLTDVLFQEWQETEAQIQQAVDRNTYYNIKLNNKEQIREVCSKINYTREDLWNGREKHTINGKVFSFPRSREYKFDDMRLNGKWDYTMDGIKSTEKYKKFQKETGMNLLSPDNIYDILWNFAQAMGITSSINYDFFESNSDESQSLLQMFRNITGFEGRIPLKITNTWKVECLCCRNVGCYFDAGVGADGVGFLVGL